MTKTKLTEGNSKIRKNIMLSKNLDRKIKEVADKLNTSQSRLISEAVKHFLARQPAEKRPVIFDFAGVFDCEHEDLSVSYKHYLTGAIKK